MMPPPMSEKQVAMPGGTDEPCQCIYMYGNTVIALAGESIVIFNAEEVKPKIKSFEVRKHGINPREVYKIVAYKKGKELIVSIVENLIKSQRKDRISVMRVGEEEEAEIIKQMEVPKVYSACISAKYHHSGYHKEEDTTVDHDNSYYTTINSGSESESPDVMFKFQKGFEVDSDNDIDEADMIQTSSKKPIQAEGGDYLFI